jgi:hypothetical protein
VQRADRAVAGVDDRARELRWPLISWLMKIADSWSMPSPMP